MVDKLPDFLSVPGRSPQAQDSVVARIKELFPQAEGSISVHRLDMATSGLMVLALTPQAHRHLSRQFEKRQVDKSYTALLEGRVKDDEGRIELAFRVDWPNRPRQIHDPIDGKLGITQWQILDRTDTTTRIRFIPLTGRTHQLRLHAAHPLGLGPSHHRRPALRQSQAGRPADAAQHPPRIPPPRSRRPRQV